MKGCLNRRYSKNKNKLNPNNIPLRQPRATDHQGRIAPGVHNEIGIRLQAANDQGTRGSNEITTHKVITRRVAMICDLVELVPGCLDIGSNMYLDNITIM